MAAAFDNDVILKAACYGLLTRFVAMVPADLQETGYLGAAPFVTRARLTRIVLTKRAEDVHGCLQKFFETAVALEPTPDEARVAAEIEFSAQHQNLQLDVGESLLCAIVACRGINTLATGDKRAISAMELLLPSERRLADLIGKAICFEQLALRAMEQFGAGEIRQRVCGEIAVDKALAIAFECASQNASDDAGTAGLKSYIDDLRKVATTLLAT